MNHLMPLGPFPRACYIHLVYSINMAKRETDQSDFDFLEIERELYLETLFCACPECGKECTRFLPEYGDDPVEPTRIRLSCRSCGETVVERVDGTTSWRVCGSDMPYIPQAPDNVATLYHRFDPKDYDSEIDALTAELTIVIDLSKACVDSGDKTLYESIQSRLDMLLELAYENGLKQFYGGYATVLLYDMLSGTHDEDSERNAIERIRSMLPDVSKDELVELMQVSNIAAFNIHALSDINSTVVRMVLDHCASLIDATPENMEYLSRVFMYFHVTNDVSNAYVLVDMMLAMVERMPRSETNDEFRLFIYSDIFEYLDEEDDIDSIMEFVEAYRDDYPLEYVKCALHYVGLFVHNGEIRDHLLDMLDVSISKMNDSGEPDIFDPDRMAQAYYLRYCISNRKGDASNASKYALMALDEGRDEFSEYIVFNLLDNGVYTATERKRVLGRMKRLGYIEDE